MYPAVSLFVANTEFSQRWKPTERRNGAPLGLHPVLQAAERLVAGVTVIYFGAGRDVRAVTFPS